MGPNRGLFEILNRLVKQNKYLYRFSTFGTGGSFGLRCDKVLVGGLVVEGGVGSFVVEEELVVGQGGGDGGDGERAVVEAPELRAGGAVRPLDAAVPLGAPGRQDAQGDVEFGAGVLEGGHELAAAVDLHGDQGEGQFAEDVEQEAPGVAGGGPRVDPGRHELRDRAGGAGGSTSARGGNSRPAPPHSSPFFTPAKSPKCV